MQGKFDYLKNDSQGTVTKPIYPEMFDIEKYADYEASLLENNKAFWQADSGIFVYRRFRVPEVFAYACKDMRLSLRFQLAALEKSMEYKADIANFLEPWYGLGTIASCFGCKYKWSEGNSPAFSPVFHSVEQALQYEAVPAHKTEIGKHTLEMIEYFLNKTRGKLPISLSDVQSPLNVASEIIDINNFLTAFFDNPASVKELLKKIADLTIDFAKKQKHLIGECLVSPGHGFASSRDFEGFGMGDDTAVMLSPKQYSGLVSPVMRKIGAELGGVVFHSCGNWTDKIETVRNIEGLKMVDGAFSSETDPDPNPTKPFVDNFADTGIVVNCRIVGDSSTVIDKVKEIFKPGMKLIVVTYCQSSEQQKEVYDAVTVVQNRV